jgi:hypothetical protein
MFFLGCLYAEIINEHYDWLMNKLEKNIAHDYLESIPCITQSKWHHNINECAPWGSEDRLVPIFKCYVHLIIPWITIHETIYFFLATSLTIVEMNGKRKWSLSVWAFKSLWSTHTLNLFPPFFFTNTMCDNQSMSFID